MHFKSLKELIKYGMLIPSDKANIQGVHANKTFEFGFHKYPTTTFDGNQLYITIYNEEHIPTHAITRSPDGIFRLYAVTTHTDGYTDGVFVASVDDEDKVWTLLNNIVEKDKVNNMVEVLKSFFR